MADRFRRGNTRVVGAKRQSDWINSADQGYVVVGANASVLHQSAAAIGNNTIIRTRGLVSVNTTSEADTEVVGAYGMGIVTAQAFAAGAASIPGPFTDADWDGWFVHGYWSYRLELAGTAGTLLIDSVEMPIDSKAMRKINGSEVLVVMCESQADACRVAINFRMLLKAF